MLRSPIGVTIIIVISSRQVREMLIFETSKALDCGRQLLAPSYAVRLRRRPLLAAENNLPVERSFFSSLVAVDSVLDWLTPS